MQLELNKIFLSFPNNTCIRFNCTYTIRDGENIIKNDLLFFEYYNVNKEDILSEVFDPFIIAVVPYCMDHNLNIVCNGPISKETYLNIVEHLVPCFAKNIKEYHNISIKANNLIIVKLNANKRATGGSTGVDSLYTILKAEKDNIPFDYLVHMNIGDYGNSGDSFSSKQFMLHENQLSILCKNLKREKISINSNIQAFYNDYLKHSGTIRRFGAIMGIAKLVGSYTMASDYSFSHVDFKEFGDASYLTFIAYALSTSFFQYKISGLDIDRDDRTNFLAEFPITYNLLNVCIFNAINCSKCEKCMRTMVSLYSMNNLELYSKVFNVDYFYKHITTYISYAIYSYKHESQKKFFIKSIPIIKKEHKRVYLYA